MSNINPRNITVFGSSWPIEGHQTYQQAYNLGLLLSKNGYNVLSGGYIGLMEAVSRGAIDNGGYTIGFSCDEIEFFRPVPPNRFLTEERRYPTLRTRIMAIIDTCDAAIALPGGIGTLAEVSLMWNHLLIQSMPPKPLIFLGDEWGLVIDQFFRSMNEYIRQEHRDLINIAHNNIEAMNFLNTFFQSKDRIENIN